MNERPHPGQVRPLLCRADVAGAQPRCPHNRRAPFSIVESGSQSRGAVKGEERKRPNFTDTKTETRTWNYRLQPATISQGTAMSLTYGFCPASNCSNNNGNVYSQLIGHATNTGGVTQSYSYDALSRLATVNEGATWSRTYAYDAYGNGWLSAFTSNVAPDAVTAISVSNYAGGKNQLQTQGSVYDAAGNQTLIQGFTRTYDAEGRLATSALAGGATTTFSYDGEGRRVKMVQGGAAGHTLTMAFGVSGEVVAEKDTAAPVVTGVRYVAVDHLGSTRMLLDGSGAAKECLDYFPYGEPLTVGRTDGCWTAADDSRLRFTGKERDSETGLDYFGARYMSSAQGRFTSPDPVNHPAASKNPAAFLMNPQRWNGYSYVSNNPMRMVDPDGREEEESWFEMGKRYLAAMFQPVSSVDAMTNPRVSGEQNAPWPTDSHEIAVAATKDAGQRAELAFNVLSALDPTGAGQLGKSIMEGSPGGVAVAAMGVMLPGGRSGGNIALSEAKQLVGGWAAGTFEKIGASIAYHFEKHGAEVGASSVWQYLRKAEGFAMNLKGASRTALENGATRYEKKGKYVILDQSKKILSYGSVE